MQRPFFVSLALCVATLTGFTPPAEARITFKLGSQLDVSAGSDPGPQAVTIADIDGVNGPDLIVVDPSNDVVTIWLNDGTGQFTEDTSEIVGAGPVAVVGADLNGDSRVDVVAVNHDSGSVTVLLQDADGLFAPPDGYEDGFAVDASPVGVVVRDLDGDRALDLAVVSDSTIHLLKGDGTGKFQNFATASVSTGSGTRGNYAIAAGNFNNDSAVDLAVSSRGGNRLAVLLGNGNGTFKSPNVYSVGVPTGNLLVQDFGGDVAYDDIALVVSNDFDVSQVNLYISDGTGSFSSPEVTGSAPGEIETLSNEAFGLAGGDLDNDGKIDLLVSNIQGAPGINALCRQPSNVCLQLPIAGQVTNPLPDENGFQLLLSAQQPQLTSAASALQSADLNNDRLADVVSLSPEGDAIRIILNTTGQVQIPTPTPTQSGGTPSPTTNFTIPPTPTPTLTTTPVPTATPTAIPTVPYTVCDTTTNTPVDIGGKIVGVATGDFDHDGNIDIAAADQSGNRVVVLLTNIQIGAATACGVLGLSRGVVLTDINAPAAIASADLDGDGWLDLAVTGSSGGSDRISIFYGDKNTPGHFEVGPSIPIEAGTSPGPLVISDVNRDGGPDLVVAHPGSSAHDVAILVRDSTDRRAYKPACTIGVGRSSDALVVQDLNRDGRPDFAIASGQTTDFTVFQQRGSDITPGPNVCPYGTTGYRGLTPFSVPSEPRAIVAGSFEQGDMVPDLALGLRGSTTKLNGRLAIVLGRAASGGDVSYELSSNLEVPAPSGATQASLPSSIGTGDVNRDGRADLILTDEQNDSVVVFLGLSSGGYGSSLIPQTLAAQRPVSMAVNDIDGDGVPDIVVADAGRNGSGGGVSVLVSRVQPNTPTPLPTFTATNTGSPTGTPTTTPTSSPTETATPGPSLTPTRVPTWSPVPTASPTKTLKPGTLSLSGGGCSVVDESDVGGRHFWLVWVGIAGLVGLRSRTRKAPL